MAQAQPSLDALRSLFDAVQRHFAHAVPGLAARTWEQARSAVVARVQEHPRATALQLAMVVPALVPGLAAGPALLGLGFGGGGIAAG
ncbi:uncharacterized protein K489DRAFT_383552, partial [Dissoconium aciculare CBS 342.82]|uniref:Uncharacterized protein n=1 Tax=Dissoconium aciculare CBS 342.82 TaxID=1314786 RepID=A0A6J3LW50_9PEZI